MTIAEVLMARGWVKQETLDRVAPWLNETTIAKPTSQTAQTAPHQAKSATKTEPQTVNPGHGESDYEHNLLVYRQLMHKILDE